MAMLDRYKKKGGFIQLLLLIETSSKQKQDQFLNLIAQENPHWEEHIRKKTLTLDKILTWNPTYVAEIFSRVQPLTVAVAMRSLTQAQTEKVMNCFSQSEQRKIQNIVTETNPSQSEIQTCVMKLIAEVRELMKTGILKMEKIDPEMVIPENIEEKLQQSALLQSLESIPVLNFHTDDEKSKTNSNESSQRTGEKNLSTKENQNSSHGHSHGSSHSSEVAGRGQSDSLREENEFLKKKIQTLLGENNQLKSELSTIKSKLEQIKRIA